jgi:hypothetical protein
MRRHELQNMGEVPELQRGTPLWAQPEVEVAYFLHIFGQMNKYCAQGGCRLMTRPLHIRLRGAYSKDNKNEARPAIRPSSVHEAAHPS